MRSPLSGRICRTNLNAGATGDDLIYAIFTSGSTGKPKGAGVYHRGFTNLVANWYVGTLAMTPGSGAVDDLVHSFDLTQRTSTHRSSPGDAGHRRDLSFDPAEFCRVIQAQQISWINCTPRAVQPPARRGGSGDAPSLPSLRTVVLGGEPIAVERLHTWAASRLGPPPHHQRLRTDRSAPTSAPRMCSISPGRGYAGSVPIGRPIANVASTSGRLAACAHGCGGRTLHRRRVGSVGAGYLNGTTPR
ncbi:MAG: AMP-binding protein [Caldilineaceae bacterium]